MAVKYNPNSA